MSEIKLKPCPFCGGENSNKITFLERIERICESATDENMRVLDLKKWEPKPLPCPFCGSKDILAFQYGITNGKRWLICCAECLTTIDPGWVQEVGYAVELWNRRADS